MPRGPDSGQRVLAAGLEPLDQSLMLVAAGHRTAPVSADRQGSYRRYAFAKEDDLVERARPTVRRFEQITHEGCAVSILLPSR